MTGRDNRDTPMTQTSDFSISKPTRTSSTGSMTAKPSSVSPMPAQSRLPSPIDDLTVPLVRLPASVMPICNGQSTPRQVVDSRHAQKYVRCLDTDFSNRESRAPPGDRHDKAHCRPWLPDTARHIVPANVFPAIRHLRQCASNSHCRGQRAPPRRHVARRQYCPDLSASTRPGLAASIALW